MKKLSVLLFAMLWGFIATGFVLPDLASAQLCTLDKRFEETNMSVGMEYYTDRDYTLKQVPSEYIGMYTIKTPNNDKSLTASSGYLTFRMAEDGMVYVAFDERASSLPKWMSEFDNTGDKIQTSLSYTIRGVPILLYRSMNVYSKPYSAGECVDLGANQAPGSVGAVNNFFVFGCYKCGTTPPPPLCSLDSRFEETLITEGMEYYTDRDYTLQNVHPKYIGMDVIKTPNNDKSLTSSSGYLTFEMVEDGMVYVAFDRRASNFPNWMSDFDNTGDIIETSASAQGHFDVHCKSYSADECVDLGANQASGSEGAVNNFFVFYGTAPPPDLSFCTECYGVLSPQGRWCDNQDGTITDMTTGLVWLKTAGWGGPKMWSYCPDYNDAHTLASSLQDGAAGSGLSDGSHYLTWRLPTMSEFLHIVKGVEPVSRLETRGFLGLDRQLFWSSTTDIYNRSQALYILFKADGTYETDTWPKWEESNFIFYVWPVRAFHIDP